VDFANARADEDVEFRRSITSQTELEAMPPFRATTIALGASVTFLGISAMQRAKLIIRAPSPPSVRQPRSYPIIFSRQQAIDYVESDVVPVELRAAKHSG
jgi:hypothetical protein